MKQTCRTCESTLCRFIEPEENWDKPNNCEQWRPFVSKNDITKTSIIRALHILVAHCNQHDFDMCPTENESECIFWKDCYGNARRICSSLEYALEKLEND